MYYTLDKTQGQAPNGCSVEITDEMLKAGEDAFAFDARFESLSEALARAYIAMRVEFLKLELSRAEFLSKEII